MLLRHRHFFKRFFCILTVGIVFAMQISVADEGIPFANAKSQVIRVLLTRLKLTDRMDVTLSSPYVLSTSDGSEIHFQEDSKLSFLLKDGKIYLYYQGMSLSAGNEIVLQRSAYNADGTSGFYLTNFPTLYMGDLVLDIHNEVLRPVLRMHVEEYLLGVVPYEMSNSFPLEALKAQAIAARTYVLRKQDDMNHYDVVDNTNDQAFRGYVAGNERAEQAVKETRGICGFYQGELAQCYYSASNGGQMERVQTIWPTKEDFGYYTFGADPYDVENPLSVVRSITIPKSNSDTTPTALKEILVRYLEDELIKRGFDPTPESVRVENVSALTLTNPVSLGSKWFKSLQMTVLISGRTKRENIVQLVDQDQEEVNLFAIPSPSPTIDPSATFAPIVTTQPTASPAPVYGPFVAIDEAFHLEIPIFPDAEEAFGMNILGHYDNEIWSINETEQAFVLEARRYGHGVGMSQRGAEWMAGNYGMNCKEILAFYYPGMKLMRYPEEPVMFHQTDGHLLETTGPAPSPTPRPTLMPVTLKAEEGQWFASVTEIADDSSLNLRAEPSLNGEILMRLYKNQKLLVLERANDEGWVRVRTDAIEGYVMESYLSEEK